MEVSRVLTGPFPLRFSARPHCPYSHVLAASRGRSPACASAQTNRRCGPKRMLSLLLVHPTASPGSPWLPPVACPPTSPCAGRATDVLARWLPAPLLAEARYNPAERQSRPKKWAAMFGNLFTLPIRRGLPHGLAPAPGIGDAAARRTRSQGRFRLVKILHTGVTGRGTAPRGDRGRCRSLALHGTEQEPAIVGARRVAVRREVGRSGCCVLGRRQTPRGGGGCACTARPQRAAWGRAGTAPYGSLPAGTVPGTRGTGDPPWAPGETRRGHPPPWDVPIPSPPGAEEMLSPPASTLRAGIDPGGS